LKITRGLTGSWNGALRMLLRISSVNFSHFCDQTDKASINRDITLVRQTVNLLREKLFLDLDSLISKVTGLIRARTDETWHPLHLPSGHTPTAHMASCLWTSGHSHIHIPPLVAPSPCTGCKSSHLYGSPR